MATVRAQLAPMSTATQTDGNGETWNLLPNKIFLKQGGNVANSADADRYITSVANLQTFMANPGGQTYTIFDLRETPLYAALHIRGAVNFPITDPDPRAAGKPRSHPISSTDILNIDQAKAAVAPTVEPHNLPTVFQNALGRDIVIFHCALSTFRGPQMATAWANYLRARGDARTKVVLLNSGFSAVERWNNNPVNAGRQVLMDRSQVATSSTNANEVAGDVRLPSTRGGLLAVMGAGRASSAPPERPPPAVAVMDTMAPVRAPAMKSPNAPPTRPTRQRQPSVFAPLEEPRPVVEQPPINLRFARRLVTAPYA